MYKRVLQIMCISSIFLLGACHKSTCPAYGDLTTKFDKNGSPKGKPKSGLFPAKMK